MATLFTFTVALGTIFNHEKLCSMKVKVCRISSSLKWRRYLNHVAKRDSLWRFEFAAYLKQRSNKSIFKNRISFWQSLTKLQNELHVFFFLRNTFSKAGSMFLKISSIWAWNVSYKFWFTPSPKNGYLQCAQLCCFFFFSNFK